ncbi:hypothetical protein Tco_1245230 [Tanacetum coccineum]
MVQPYSTPTCTESHEPWQVTAAVATVRTTKGEKIVLVSKKWGLLGSDTLANKLFFDCYYLKITQGEVRVHYKDARNKAVGPTTYPWGTYGDEGCDTTVPKENPNYPIWVSNDAHVRMLIISTISEASFRHVQEMHGDETPDAYLTHAQEYADVLAAIDEPIKDKDLIVLAVSELHVLLSDHDYMLGKTRAPAPSITSSFAANYAVGSPSMPEARQAQLSELTAQLSALGFQVSPITPSGPQAFYGTHPSNNNRNNNNNNRGNHNNSRGNNNNRGIGNGR